MATIIEGNLNCESKKIAIVASRFNFLIVEKLIAGAKDTLIRHGLDEKNLDIVFVPGAFEIPLASLALCKTGKYNGLVALGAVIKGETDHYDYVCSEVAKGISKVMLETGTPVSFGVLTVNTMEQALDRAGAKAGNKGSESAMALIEMCNLLNKINK